MAWTKSQKACAVSLVLFSFACVVLVAMKEVSRRKSAVADDKSAVASLKQSELQEKQEPPEKRKPASKKGTLKPASSPSTAHESRDFKAESEAALKEQGHETLLKVIWEWSARDQVAALEWALELPEGDDRTFGFTAALSAWTETDAPAAAKWAATLPEGDDRLWGLSAAALAWTDKDPVAAAQWAVMLPEGKSRSEALNAVASKWAEKDPVAAESWVKELPDDDEADFKTHDGK